MFRVKVTSKDGYPATVCFQIDDHPGEARPYVLGNLADCLRLDKSQVLDVFENWSRDQLVEHLEQFTRDELKPPFLRT